VEQKGVKGKFWELNHHFQRKITPKSPPMRQILLPERTGKGILNHLRQPEWELSGKAQADKKSADEENNVSRKPSGEGR
jgi:hypothetical protein